MDYLDIIHFSWNEHFEAYHFNKYPLQYTLQTLNNIQYEN